ncbi:MAG: corrinoid protein [Defluviitaleaceae bacterium]|nr:corrinoid protein [Defluviitaleaceae bacterium]MCL2835511.1 corrinoid protein [Defluviitaleaceae bacterium]
MSELINQISEALQSGKAKAVTELIEQALSENVSSKDILEKGLLAGMDIVADKFQKNEVYVPEVLIAARAMNAGTTLLKPHLAEAGAKPIGKAIIGTVKGDLHDIGKNLVRMMFEGKGIEVVDLGVDVSPEKFVEAYETEKPDVVALSALLTTTMGEMKNTVEAFTAAGIRDSVTIMIGGAPVTDSFRNSAGADIYTADAASAAEAAKQAILNK